MDFISTLGADVIVLQPPDGLAGDSLPLGTREGSPGAATGGAAGAGVSGSSIMKTSSPTAAGLERRSAAESDTDAGRGSNLGLAEGGIGPVDTRPLRLPVATGEILGD